MPSRYGHAGRLYDLVSLEPLYRSSRRRLLAMVDLRPGMTVIDVGCGTGRNLSTLVEAVGPGGRIIGIDASASMLAAAQRRVERAELVGVTLLGGDALALDTVVRAAGIETSSVDAMVVTFVLSLVADDAPFWSTVDQWSAARSVRIALADLGRPQEAPVVARPMLHALTTLGGGDPDRRPWDRLLTRCADGIHEVRLGGHVHLAVGTCGGPAVRGAVLT